MDRYDKCECGDYRHQHLDGGEGACIVCRYNPVLRNKCREFRLAKEISKQEKSDDCPHSEKIFIVSYPDGYVCKKCGELLG